MASENEFPTDSVIVHHCDEVRLGQVAWSGCGSVSQLAHRGHEMLALFEVWKKLARPLVVYVYIKVVSLEDDKSYSTASAAFDKLFYLLPVALKFSPPATTSTVVSKPSASLEQQARNLLVMYSYTLLSSPLRLFA